MDLTPADDAMLRGDAGPAAARALRILIRFAGITGATTFRDITAAHIDGCLFHGDASLDFAELLERDGAKARVPTTLNVGTLDLLHPTRFRGDAVVARKARRLMDAYVAMGCRATWTCAPYQLRARPGFGEHIAWAESNAIVFANSVLGARTNRYGDFIDLCAAITGRVPDTGLHRTENRRGEIVFQLDGLSERLLGDDSLYPVLGHVIGRESGTSIPVIDGLPPPIHEDRLKALGAAAASSGAVALFHVVGTTPEAPTLDAALHGGVASRVVRVTTAMLRRAADSLSTSNGKPLVAVSLGTPHFSVDEFAALTPLLAGRHRHPSVDFYVSTGRDVLAEVERRGWLPVYEAAGVELVVDTCTYITPILRRVDGTVMTNSAKWAYYAPGNLGVDVAFGSMVECVESAVHGAVRRDASLWGDS